jgi:hypothetical protein
MFSHGFEPSVRRQRCIAIQRDRDDRWGSPQSGISATQYEQSERCFIEARMFNLDKKGKVRRTLTLSDADPHLVSSGVRHVRIPLSYLDVLYTCRPESPRQFSRFPLQDRFFGELNFRGHSDSSMAGPFPLSLSFLPFFGAAGNRVFALPLAGAAFLRSGSQYRLEVSL